MDDTEAEVEAKSYSLQSTPSSSFFRDNKRFQSGCTNNWACVLRAQSKYEKLRHSLVGLDTDLVAQGFDEFMNLVIEDAVEVKQPTKANPDEIRKRLGTCCIRGTGRERLIGYRPDIAQRR